MSSESVGNDAEGDRVGAAMALDVCEPLDEPGSAGLAVGALNATNVHVAAGSDLPTAVLDRDVALVVTGGGGVLVVDQVEQELTPGMTVIMRAGSARSIHAGQHGLQVTTAHARRSNDASELGCGP